MIYLHYKSPAHIYPPKDSEDTYVSFTPSRNPAPTCSQGTCSTCPLNIGTDCAPYVTELLNLYPNPTILTPDTHPEIFL